MNDCVLALCGTNVRVVPWTYSGDMDKVWFDGGTGGEGCYSDLRNRRTVYRENLRPEAVRIPDTPRMVYVIGSGPAGVACAYAPVHSY